MEQIGEDLRYLPGQIELMTEELEDAVVEAHDVYSVTFRELSAMTGFVHSWCHKLYRRGKKRHA